MIDITRASIWRADSVGSNLAVQLIILLSRLDLCDDIYGVSSILGVNDAVDRYHYEYLTSL